MSRDVEKKTFVHWLHLAAKPSQYGKEMGKKMFQKPSETVTTLGSGPNQILSRTSKALELLNPNTYTKLCLSWKSRKMYQGSPRSKRPPRHTLVSFSLSFKLNTFLGRDLESGARDFRLVGSKFNLVHFQILTCATDLGQEQLVVPFMCSEVYFFQL